MHQKVVCLQLNLDRQRVHKKTPGRKLIPTRSGLILSCNIATHQLELEFADSLTPGSAGEGIIDIHAQASAQEADRTVAQQVVSTCGMFA